ncbi:MAG TPA: hypothetical protein VKD90_24710 [Gemmataceae bacterium]|nr:hypothetical protein [Gemmataceae bacterium]
MLRLTLRTLLAYLDDTLPPAQAKAIGEKVAESEFAQQTVERIKTVTRRRRLTAPPVEADDQSTDPNTIAEYLDNVLPAEQLAEVEQASLDNDTRLAEVAACHQILTLVLGEPAKIPPTARRRMYRIVRGPESLPYRPVAAANAPVAGLAAPVAVDEFHDQDEDLLESVFGPRKLLWLLGLLVVVGLLGVALWRAIPPSPPQPTQGYVAVAPVARLDAGPKVPVGPPKKPETPVVVDKKPETPVEPKLPEPKADDANAIIEAAPAPRLVGGAPAVREPDSERRAVAVWDTPPQPLLFRKRETVRWEKASIAEPQVSSTDQLLALPGFHPELRLDTGVRLQMWGNVPEFVPVGVSESRLTLHVPPQSLAADFTLHGGRVFLTAPKAPGPVVVRVRFAGEVWDVTLADGQTEVAIDLIGEPARTGLFDRDLPESPRLLAYLGVTEGSATVRIGDFQSSGELTAGTRYKWDSKGGRPAPAPKDDPDEVVPSRWRKDIPATASAKDMAAAVTEMARRISIGQGPFDVDFDATIKDSRESTSRRALAAWMLAAQDSLSYLIDAVEADAAAVRDAAARSLQHWCAQEAGREEAFAQVLAMKAMYNEAQRLLVANLIQAPERPVAEKTVDRLFELLGNDKLAVRELARMQLAKLDPPGARE